MQEDRPLLIVKELRRPRPCSPKGPSQAVFPSQVSQVTARALGRSQKEEILDAQFRWPLFSCWPHSEATA